MDSAVEAALRQRIMDWVRERAEMKGGFLTYNELLAFQIDGQDLPLIDRWRGIRNPATFASSLSVVSSVDGPYADLESRDGFYRYDYQKGDPDHPTNSKLRAAIQTQHPLILFRKEIPGIYTPVLPVYAVRDLRAERQFVLALDESLRFVTSIEQLTVPERAYATRLARQRLHQPAFRTRVLVAYRTSCAVCRLGHGALLDAAHIVPDSDERGTPTVPNGLAMCKIHHAAYDADLLGISPDYQVHITGRLLHEKDGPMLRHGLQEMHGSRLLLPERRKDHPAREFLDLRHQRFLARV